MTEISLIFSSRRNDRQTVPRGIAKTSRSSLTACGFTATVSRFLDGRISELFLNNHKFGNQSDTNARDASIILSFALQHGADIDIIRKALCRNAEGRALGPIGAALDLLAADGKAAQ